jgi:transposase
VARYRQPVRAVIESMNGARFVHDTLEEHGWEVLVADAQKVKVSRPEFRGDPEARMLSWWEGSLLHDACPEEVRR